MFLVTTGGLWLLSAVLPPSDGDLSRIGGFPEHDFHWRNPQLTLSKNLFHVASDLKEYDRDFDVVVLGDSFSCDQESRFFGWQSFFIRRTGLSVIVFDMRKYWPRQILESEGFQKHPPRVFVFESVERYLYERTAYFSTYTPVPLAPAIPGPRRKPQVPEVRVREDLRKESGSLDPNQVISFLKAAVLRHLGINTQVVQVPLKENNHFSSRNKQLMLVYFDEFDKKAIVPESFGKLRAGMLALQNLVESNGLTRLVFLIAPDKTSLFAYDIQDESFVTANLIEEAAYEPRLHLIRTDQILGESIRSGIPDIYLPNDSHWGSTGHQRIADSLADFLEESGFFENVDTK